MFNLIQITEDKFDVKLDIRYATKNNVLGEAIYKQPLCYLHPEAIKSLEKAIILAKIQGYKLKIFDGYRPLQNQQYFFDKFPGGFVSNPANGVIPHCRGVAIDLTLIDQNNIELEMGTEFDNFTDLANHACIKVSSLAQKNRFILMGIMLSSGFNFLAAEWWHYQLPDARNYEVIKDFII